MGRPAGDLLHDVSYWSMNAPEGNQMNVYKKKREFIEALRPALLMIADMVSGLEDVKYDHFADKYAEYVRVVWEGGYKDYIDVTGDSLTAMMSELSKLFAGKRPVGLITNEAHRNVIEGWFKAAEAKESQER